MDFMKNISRADCDFFDSMPQAEKDNFSAQIIEAQEWRRGLLNIEQIANALNLSKRGVNDLPLNFVRPFRKTKRGMRRVKSVNVDDLRSFLTARCATYAAHAFEEPLLKPTGVVGMLKQHGTKITGRGLSEMRHKDEGPQFIRLNQRVTRYRAVDVLDWVKEKTTAKSLAPSELIMETNDGN